MKKYVHPIFDSPLEESFFNSISDLLKKKITLIPQSEIETKFGKFRIDFVIENASRQIGIELDSLSTHDKNAQVYDFWRDSILLIEEHVDVLYRFNGNDISNKIDVILNLFSVFEKDIFKTSYLAGRTPIVYSPHKNFMKVEMDTSHEKWIEMRIEKAIEQSRLDIYQYIQASNKKRLNPLIYSYFKKNGHYGF